MFLLYYKHQAFLFYKENQTMNNISNIHVLPINGENNCVAIVSLTLCNAVNLTGLKLYVTKNGNKYISYPINHSSKHKAHIVYPIDEQLRKDIVVAVWEVYEKEKSINEKTENV